MHRHQLTLMWFLAFASLSRPASAQSYQPLASGLRWVFASPSGADRDTIISVGPTVFDGLNVVEFQYHGFNEGLSNFWSVDPDGTVLFYGFDLPAESFTVHYVPPMRMVVPPMITGHTWRDTIRSLCLRGCEADTTPTISVSTVNSVGPLTVPAGTFEAAGVEMHAGFAAMGLRSGYTYLGTKSVDPRTSASAGGSVRWWTDGVGLIQNWDGWNLLSFDSATATRVTRWGQLKSRYR